MECDKFFRAESSEKYLERKSNAVLQLKSNSKTSGLPQLQDVELDLEIYQSALRTHVGPPFPCPWYLGDMSWLPTELAESEVDEETWDTPRHLHDLVDSASASCELCILLLYIIQHSESFRNSTDLRLGAWLHMHSISLKPTLLRFLVQGPIEHTWIFVHINLKDGVKCKLLFHQRNQLTFHSKPTPTPYLWWFFLW